MEIVEGHLALRLTIENQADVVQEPGSTASRVFEGLTGFQCLLIFCPGLDQISEIEISGAQSVKRVERPHVLAPATVDLQRLLEASEGLLQLATQLLNVRQVVERRRLGPEISG